MEVFFDEEEEKEFAQENGGSDDDAEMNYIRCLFKREINNLSLDEQQAALIIDDPRIQLVRTLALSAMLLKAFQLRFLVRRVYVSVVCLDRFLASGRINGATVLGMWVLGVACLSLSAQMDDSRVSVPALSQYEYPDRDYPITGGHIRRMQRLILYEFNWNIPFVTPFPFADFFLSRFNRQVSEATRMRTVLFILMAVLDVRLMTQRSSVVAVAVVLFAVNNNMTRQELETEIKVLPLNEFLNIDDVWYCYNRLQRLNTQEQMRMMANNQVEETSVL